MGEGSLEKLCRDLEKRYTGCKISGVRFENVGVNEDPAVVFDMSNGDTLRFEFDDGSDGEYFADENLATARVNGHQLHCDFDRGPLTHRSDVHEHIVKHFFADHLEPERYECHSCSGNPEVVRESHVCDEAWSRMVAKFKDEHPGDEE